MPTLRPVTAPSAEADVSAGEDPVPLTAARRPHTGPADPQKFAVTVAPSAIEGQGAFAGQFIPARRKIGEIRGVGVGTAQAHQRARAAERAGGHIFMIALSHQRSLDATDSTDPLRFANHACEPNTVLKVEQGRVAFYALRDIEPGEELTARYGPTHHAGRLVCRCGSARCVGRL